MKGKFFAAMLLTLAVLFGTVHTSSAQRGDRDRRDYNRDRDDDRGYRRDYDNGYRGDRWSRHRRPYRYYDRPRHYHGHRGPRYYGPRHHYRYRREWRPGHWYYGRYHRRYWRPGAYVTVRIF